MNIGIIGYGVVGKATHNSLPTYHNVHIYDPALGFKDDMSAKDAVFICVPTPTSKGEQDLSILESSLRMLANYPYNGLVIIKSTTTPKNIEKIIKKRPYLNIMVSPEFLDQNKPYFKQKKHLMGVTNIDQALKYRDIFYEDDDFRTTNPKAAMMAKYMHNVYGAIKVGVFNEFFDACEDEGIDYRESVGAMLGMTDHISRNYTRIAVDGYRGFAGACFPKDITAYNSDFPNKITQAVIDENKKYRAKDMNKVL